MRQSLYGDTHVTFSTSTSPHRLMGHHQAYFPFPFLSPSPPTHCIQGKHHRGVLSSLQGSPIGTTSLLKGSAPTTDPHTACGLHSPPAHLLLQHWHHRKAPCCVLTGPTGSLRASRYQHFSSPSSCLKRTPGSHPRGGWPEPPIPHLGRGPWRRFRLPQHGPRAASGASRAMGEISRLVFLPVTQSRSSAEASGGRRLVH